MNEKQSEMWDLLAGLEAEAVLGLLTDYHGLQLLDDGFYQHLIDEGYIDEPEEEDLDAFSPEQLRELAIKENDFEMYCDTYRYCIDCPIRVEKPGDCTDRFRELVKKKGGNDDV